MAKFKKILLGDMGLIPKPQTSSNLSITDFPFQKPTAQPNYINDLEVIDRMPVSGTYGIKSIASYDKYIQVKLYNQVGEITGKIWENKQTQKPIIDELSTAQALVLSGVYNEYPANSGNMSINVYDYHSLDLNAVSNTELIVKSIYDQNHLDNLLSELKFYLSLMTSDHQETAIELLDLVWDQFIIAPAALGHHHNYINGLFEHTIEVMRVFHYLATKSNTEMIESVLEIQNLQTQCYIEDLSDKINSGKYVRSGMADDNAHYDWFINQSVHLNDSNPNLSLGLFATLFHDMAKIVEYAYPNDDKKKSYQQFLNLDHDAEKTITLRSDPIGSIYGHIYMGSQFLINQNSKITHKLSVSDIITAQSYILSHHGLPEWGAICKPIDTTALLIHMADFIDSRFASEM